MLKRKRHRNSYEQVFKDWYGDELGGLEIESYQTREQKLDTVLDDVLSYLDKDDQVLLRKILDEWPTLIGDEIGHFTSPRKIYNKVLYIEVYDTAWLFNLERNLKPEIQKLIQKITNHKIVGIRFIPGGKTKTFYKFNKRKVKS